jgi:hypothetical protein
VPWELLQGVVEEVEQGSGSLAIGMKRQSVVEEADRELIEGDAMEFSR